MKQAKAEKIKGEKGKDESKSRKSDRKNYTYNDKLNAEIIIDKKKISVTLLDLSLQGMGVAVLEQNLDLTLLKINTAITIHLKNSLKEKDVRYEGIVANISTLIINHDRYKRIGILFCSKNTSKERVENQRKRKRFFFSKEYGPIAYIYEDKLFHDVLYLKTIEVSSEGLSLFLQEGQHNQIEPKMVLPLKLLFPKREECGVTVVVKNVYYEKGGSGIRIGVQYVDPPREFLLKVAEFITVTNLIASNQELESAGFPPLAHLKREVVFKEMESQKDFQNILDLRLLVTEEKSNKSQRTKNLYDISKMVDQFDEFSRPIMGLMDNKLVTSARIIFNDGDLTKVESLSYGLKLPSKIEASSFVEFSKFTIHPSYPVREYIEKIVIRMLEMAYYSGHSYALIPWKRENEKDLEANFLLDLGAIKIGEKENYTFYSFDIEKRFKDEFISSNKILSMVQLLLGDLNSKSIFPKSNIGRLKKIIQKKVMKSLFNDKS